MVPTSGRRIDVDRRRCRRGCGERDGRVPQGWEVKSRKGVKSGGWWKKVCAGGDVVKVGEVLVEVMGMSRRGVVAVEPGGGVALGWSYGLIKQQRPGVPNRLVEMVGDSGLIRCSDMLLAEPSLRSLEV